MHRTFIKADNILNDKVSLKKSLRVPSSGATLSSTVARRHKNVNAAQLKYGQS